MRLIDLIALYVFALLFLAIDRTAASDMSLETSPTSIEQKTAGALTINAMEENRGVPVSHWMPDWLVKVIEGGWLKRFLAYFKRGAPVDEPVVELNNLEAKSKDMASVDNTGRELKEKIKDAWNYEAAFNRLGLRKKLAKDAMEDPYSHARSFLGSNEIRVMYERWPHEHKRLDEEIFRLMGGNDHRYRIRVAELLSRARQKGGESVIKIATALEELQFDLWTVLGKTDEQVPDEILDVKNLKDADPLLKDILKHFSLHREKKKFKSST